MAVFLHKPIPATPEGIQALVKNQVAESAVLEVKEAMPGGANSPKAKVELSISVASFLNADGGDIILGGVKTSEGPGDDKIEEFSSRYAGEDLSEPQLRAILQTHLDPRDAVTDIVFNRVEFTDPEKGKIVSMVIRVPPYPHGLVAVMSEEKKGEKEARNKRLNYCFPLRQGDGTLYLSREESMMRSDARARQHYLILRECLADTEETLVDFTSGIRSFNTTLQREVRLNRGRSPVGIYLVDVTPSTFTAVFTESAMAHFAMQADGMIHVVDDGAVSVVMPLNMISSAWVSATEPPCLSIILDCDLLYDKNRIYLRQASPGAYDGPTSFYPI